MSKLAVLDLFSGIGGFSLGLERAQLEGAEYDGFETVAFCEIEEFPRRILAKHWPDVPCYSDVRELTGERLRADGIAVDVICGGFPCQGISSSGKRAGLEDPRSGLWKEYARLVDELRPRIVIVENVADLVSRGLGTVLGDLAAMGFDAVWMCIGAADVGAPHLRQRLWIVAYPGCEQHEGYSSEIRGSIATQLACPVSDTKGFGLEEQWLSAQRREVVAELAGRSGCSQNSKRPGDWWAVEPHVGRVANGVPDRVDRLKALGNAVVPQIPEILGNAILRSLASERLAA